MSPPWRHWVSRERPSASTIRCRWSAASWRWSRSPNFMWNIHRSGSTAYGVRTPWVPALQCSGTHLIAGLHISGRNLASWRWPSSGCERSSGGSTPTWWTTLKPSEPTALMPVLGLRLDVLLQPGPPVRVRDDELVGVAEQHHVVQLEQRPPEVADHRHPGGVELAATDRRDVQHVAGQVVGRPVLGVVVDDVEVVGAELPAVVGDPERQHPALVAAEGDRRDAQRLVGVALGAGLRLLRSPAGSLRRRRSRTPLMAGASPSSSDSCAGRVCAARSHVRGP